MDRTVPPPFRILSDTFGHRAFVPHAEDPRCGAASARLLPPRAESSPLALGLSRERAPSRAPSAAGNPQEYDSEALGTYAEAEMLRLQTPPPSHRDDEVAWLLAVAAEMRHQAAERAGPCGGPAQREIEDLEVWPPPAFLRPPAQSPLFEGLRADDASPLPGSRPSGRCSRRGSFQNMRLQLSSPRAGDTDKTRTTKTRAEPAAEEFSFFGMLDSLLSV